MNRPPICPIWGTVTSLIEAYSDGDRLSVDSPRAGGLYSITGTEMAIQRSAQDKARLTTWLIDQRTLGISCPNVTTYVGDEAAQVPRLSVQDRADRLLKCLAEASDTIGQYVQSAWAITANIVLPSMYAWETMLAWSESTEQEELFLLLDYLKGHEWIDEIRDNGRTRVKVTVEGHGRLAELEKKQIDSSQAFVAMWFDNSMKPTYDEGFEKAIEDAGYKAFRIDRKDHINKIDDEIVAEIRRSRFVVADFTQGESGARGGVYYEAGFAHGLNIPVIFTCREDVISHLHFDTRQFNHIVWKTPEDLRTSLANRIGAVIGDGPLR